MVGWQERSERRQPASNNKLSESSQKKLLALNTLYQVQSKMLHVFYFMMLLADNLCAIIKILSTSTWHTTNSYTKWAFNGFAAFSSFCEFIYIGNLQKCGCFSFSLIGKLYWLIWAGWLVDSMPCPSSFRFDWDYFLLAVLAHAAVGRLLFIEYLLDYCDHL